MAWRLRPFKGAATLAKVAATLVAFTSFSIAQASELKLPYVEAGLSAPQAAAILLDRFAHGPRPGEVAQLVELGLGRWFDQQLAATGNDAPLNGRLSRFAALGMTDQQLFAKYPSGSQIAAHARRFYDLIPPADSKVDFEWSSRKLAQFRKEQGYESQENELYRQLTAQKLVRAVYAADQLNEVMTEFWENHFYVTSSNFRSCPWILAYETKAVRPYALGNFRSLLGAVARHPARIQATLGDAEPSSVKPADTTMGRAFVRLEAQGQQQAIDAVRRQLDAIASQEDLFLQKRFWPATGANLEYARLLLQQTIGSQGYEPADLRETARVFTGWSTLPYGVSGQWFEGGFAAARVAGFEQQGSFVFRADYHDALPKHVLDANIADGGGLEEGGRLLDLLAAHPATAVHISEALATQFAGANPSPKLVKTMSVSYRRTGGDIRQVLRTLVQSTEFWRAAAAHDQQKTPLQYVASGLRASQAEISDAKGLTQWIADMGQPLYLYLDNNGPPPNRQWLDAGQLTVRVNFALALGDDRIEGVRQAQSQAKPDAELAMLIAGPQFQLR